MHPEVGREEEETRPVLLYKGTAKALKVSTPAYGCEVIDLD